MNLKSALPCILAIAGLLLGACAPTITVPINPPEIGLTIVVGGSSSSESTQPPAPAPTSQGEGGSPTVTTLLIYGVLVLAGIALLMALFGLLGRPDR